MAGQSPSVDAAQRAALTAAVHDLDAALGALQARLSPPPVAPRKSRSLTGSLKAKPPSKPRGATAPVKPPIKRASTGKLTAELAQGPKRPAKQPPRPETRPMNQTGDQLSLTGRNDA